MPEYQLRQDKNGMYYNEPVYSEEELAEMQGNDEVNKELAINKKTRKAKAKS